MIKADSEGAAAAMPVASAAAKVSGRDDVVSGFNLK
jgi:hypothetical protein